MSISFTWLVKHRVLHGSTGESVSVADLATAAQGAAGLLQQSAAPLIHLLLNIENLREYPDNLGEFSRAIDPLYRLEHLGWVINYGAARPLDHFINTTAARMYQIRYRLFQTQAEALQFLNSMDQTLPDLEALFKP